jgi:hypothetical protein
MRLAAALVLLTACGGSTPRPAPASRAILVVQSPVADATLWVDDQPIGELRRLPGGVRMEAGPHRVELRHDAHHNRYAEVTLAPDERRVLELTLTPIEP